MVVAPIVYRTILGLRAARLRPAADHSCLSRVEVRGCRRCGSLGTGAWMSGCIEDDPEHLKARAAEAIVIAEKVADAESKRAMQEMAAEFMKLAEQAEKRVLSNKR
jgi:hypothetical protein